MKRPGLVAVGLAAVGSVAIVVGIYQDLLHVAPAYQGTIETGWGGDLNHEEYLMALLGALGVAGAVATLRWRSLAAVPMAMGVVVLSYPLQAVSQYARNPGLYTDVQTYGGDTIRFVLGAEPFLLTAGGLFLVVAGLVGWRAHAGRTDAGEVATDPPSAA